MIKEGVRVIKKTNWRKTIVFFILISLFILSLFYHKEEQDNNYKESFKGETIGLATRFKYGRKTIYVQYYFYLDKKIISKISVKKNDPEVFNKFYKVKYDLNNPQESYIVLKEELEPDSISLVKAGFTKTKYYIYDAGVTCKYIEKTKWK